MRRCAMWEKRWAFLTKETRNFNDVYADVGPSSSIRQFVGKRKLGCLKHVARRSEEAPGLAVPPFGSRLGFGERRSGEGADWLTDLRRGLSPSCTATAHLMADISGAPEMLSKMLDVFWEGEKLVSLVTSGHVSRETQRPQVEKLA